MTDLEQRLTDHLQHRATAVSPRYDLEAVEHGLRSVEYVGREDPRSRRPVFLVLAAAAAVAIIVGLAVVSTRAPVEPSTVATPTVVEDPEFSGVWVSTDIDGSAQTMEIKGVGDGSVEVRIQEAAWDGAIVRAGKVACGVAATTLTGTGELDGSGELVVTVAAVTCVDGSEPVVSAGELADLRFAREAGSDTLTDDSGVVWHRKGADDPTAPPATDGTSASPAEGEMWPQSGSQEVQAAQELADAGDPAYTWQVDPQLSTGDWASYLVRNPNTVEIVSRFLREELGWGSYMVYQGGDTAQRTGEFILIDLVYLRCAPGETNPLYPIPTAGDTRGAESCAPTIDELHYEAVRIDLSQLADQGPEGIWVVSRWNKTEPFAQADPDVVEAAATAQLEDFLRARIAGEGAEGYVAVERSDEEVSLLYATTNGAPYERFEIELVSGPVWPDGWMEFTVRLYAEGAETVVEQGISGSPGHLSHIPAGTTENGEPVPVPYVFLDGEVTASATAPWVMSRLDDRGLDRSREESAERVELVADPRPVATGCAPGPVPVDAEALAASLQSDPDLVSTAPVRVSIGGQDGLQMDVTVTPGASICQANGYASTLALVQGKGSYEAWEPPGVAADVGSRMRLYLLDMPEGSATRILAIAVVAPEPSFETVVEAAAPILDSIQFRS